jgi:hypothetical protein
MYTIKSFADMLSYIPVSLGFQPKESVVALTFDGNRLGATLRVDLPPTWDEKFEATFASYLAQARSSQAVLAIYSSENEDLHRAQVYSLSTHLEKELPVRIVDAAVIGPETWLDMSTGERAPSVGLEFTPLVASIVANGDDAKKRYGIPGYRDGLETERMGERIDRRWRKITDPGGDVMDGSRATAMVVWNRLLAGGAKVTETDAVWMAAFLKDIRLRDELMLRTFTPHPDISKHKELFFGDVGDLTWDKDRYYRALDLVMELLSWTPAQHRANLLAYAGWLLWLQGSGNYALQYLAAALEVEPDHRFSRLFHEVINRGNLSVSAGIKDYWVD